MKFKTLTTVTGEAVTINPNFVTLIEPNPFEARPHVKSRVWVIGDAGYHTKAIYFLETVEEITKKIAKA